MNYFYDMAASITENVIIFTRIMRIDLDAYEIVNEFSM